MNVNTQEDPMDVEIEMEIEGTLVQVVDIHYLPEDCQTGDHRYRHGTVWYSVGDPTDVSGSAPMDVSFLICDSQAQAEKIFFISTKAPHEAKLRSWFVTYSTKLKTHVVCFERFSKVLELMDIIKENYDRCCSVFTETSDARTRWDFNNKLGRRRQRKKEDEHFILPYLKNGWTDSAGKDTRALIKRLINALKLMHSCGVSCSKLETCSSYVLTSDGEVKIFYADESEESGDRIDWSTHIKNLGVMIDNVIVYPSSEDWPGKLMFIRCFDSNEVQLSAQSSRFDLLLKNPFLEEDSDKLLEVFFKLELASQNFKLIMAENNYMWRETVARQDAFVRETMMKKIKDDFGLTPVTFLSVCKYIDEDDLEARKHEFACFDDLRIKIRDDKTFGIRVLSKNIMSDDELKNQDLNWYQQIPPKFVLKTAFDVEDPNNLRSSRPSPLHNFREDPNSSMVIHGGTHDKNQAMTRSEMDFKSLVGLIVVFRHILYHFDEKGLSTDKLLEEISETWPLLVYYLHEYAHGRVN